MHPTQPEETKQPRLTVTQVCVLSLAAVATAFAVAWPICDNIYHHTFTSPGAWWLLVLITLASWITFVVLTGVLTGQQRILAQLDELRDCIAAYGDYRESDGHAVAARMRSNGTVRQLNSVE